MRHRVFEKPVTAGRLPFSAAQLNCGPRYFRALSALLIFIAVEFYVVPTQAVPVYLEIQSRFPSGHHRKKALESRTKKIQAQRWLRLETPRHQVGWLPEEELLTSLKLARETILVEATPLRREPSLQEWQGTFAAKGSRVEIMGFSGSWVHALVELPSGSSQPAWLPSESLDHSFPSRHHIVGQKVFVPKAMAVSELPGQTKNPHSLSTRRHTIPGATIASVLRSSKDWLEIESPHGKGWVARSSVITAADLSDERAIVLGPSTQLLSAPLPYADRVRTSEPLSQPLKILASESLRWGKARLPDVGEIWWPMVDSEDADEDARVLNTAEIISSEQLFARKIFDMAASPTDPSVQFASAKGVFRTFDGKKWKKLDLFEDRNYPIAISGTGAVFIGPYVSDNHGENFQQWIRWDSLVATLRRKVGRPPEQLQIREIRSEDPTGRRVVLKLFVGDSKLVRLSTNDRGQTWRSL